MTALRSASAALIALTVIALSGCAPDSDRNSPRPAEFGYQKRPAQALLDEGQAAYKLYCVGCHGADGDGKGEAARFLRPSPRNFQIANYKFSTTRSGQLPTDEDLTRSIREGLKGSAMPSWDLLPDRTAAALVAYLKTFSSKWAQRRPAPAIPFVEDPYRSMDDKSQAIVRGEAVYHGFATCWTCHPSYVSTDRINEYLVAMENPPRAQFRPGLRRSDPKANSEGELVFPPDFKRDFVRAGMSVKDLYRSIGTGITGTAMPTWVDSLNFPSSKGDGLLVEPSDIWALAYYVQGLIGQRPVKLAEATFEVRNRPQQIYLTGEWPRLEAPPTPGGTETEFFDEDEFEEEEFEEDEFEEEDEDE